MTKYILSALIGILVICSVVLVMGDNRIRVSSVVGGNEYNSTTTMDWGNSGTFDKQLKVGPGTLGSVVITVSAATKLRLLDAYSAATAASATTTLATFVASPTVGTYTFDTVFQRGLYAIVDGGGASLASTTITWR